MTKAIGYIRVSTDEQSDQGASLAAQRSKIEAWATFTDAQLIAIYEDAGLSGKHADNRPALQQALQAARRHHCPLVVYSLSRLSRSIRDTLTISEDLERSGADLVSLSEDLNTSSASGRLVFRIFSVLAQFEREQLAERTTAAMAYLRREGRRISGRIPYGYCLDGDGRTLIPVEDEQTAINMMVELRSQGSSYRAICETLARRGYHPQSAPEWSPAAVRGILKRHSKLAETVGA
ncbi:MAG: recombinase family protein [Planctomycetota bacterium]|nr:MAG: recombinase family protein [Planctomycetota bacterium]